MSATSTLDTELRKTSSVTSIKASSGYSNPKPCDYYALNAICSAAAALDIMNYDLNASLNETPKKEEFVQCISRGSESFFTEDISVRGNIYESSSSETTLTKPFLVDNFTVMVVSAPKKISEYVSNRPDLQKLIESAVSKIALTFGTPKKLRLKWTSDPDGKELFLIITTTLEVEEAHHRFSNFLKSWIKLSYNQRNMLHIGLDVL